MQNQSSVQKYTVTLTWDDHVLIDGTKGSSSKTYEVKRGDKWSAPISFEYGYQLLNIDGATIVNDELVIDAVTSNVNINVTSETMSWTITYNLTNIEKGNPAPDTVKHGEDFYVVLKTLDNYNINPESITVTNCKSWRHEDLISENNVIQTTIYITGSAGNIVVTASAIKLEDSYNVNIVTQPLSATILTSYTEDENLSNTTTLTGNINKENKIYIYLPWKYNWIKTEIYADGSDDIIDNVSITDAAVVIINDVKYNKTVLTITAVENYQTPDIEILITAEERPSYNITFKDVDDVVNWYNPITSAYDGQEIIIKPIILDEYHLSQISIVEQSGTTIWNTDEDISAAINGEKTITITGDTIISASYDITFSWNNLENYILGEELSSMSSSGSVTRNYEVTKGGHYFFAQANDGYEFSNNPSIIVSNPDAEWEIITNDGTNIEFRIISYKNTTISIDGVNKIVETIYDLLNIEVTNNAFDQTITFNMRQFQGDSYPGMSLIYDQGEEFVNISGFNGNSSLSVQPNTTEGYNKNYSKIDFYGDVIPVNSLEIRMYGEILDPSSKSLSKKQTVYATIYDSVNNVTHTSTNHVEIDGNNSYSSGQYVLTFDQLLAIDSKHPLTLHYIINE